MRVTELKEIVYDLQPIRITVEDLLDGFSYDLPFVLDGNKVRPVHEPNGWCINDKLPITAHPLPEGWNYISNDYINKKLEEVGMVLVSNRDLRVTATFANAEELRTMISSSIRNLYNHYGPGPRHTADRLRAAWL